jgi:hypothetical protein
MLHFARAKRIAKVAPAFSKMVQDNDEDEWFKIQVWFLQYLIHDFKESDSVIIDVHDPEVFKLRLVQNDGWDAVAKHVRFGPFATIYFHVISKRYLEHTSSHLIGKLKSFVVSRMSFGKHVKNPLKWTSVVEATWHDLQGGIKCFDPEALSTLELVLHVYNSGDPQWAQWATSFNEQHNKPALTIAEVLQSVIDRHDLHTPVSVTLTPPSHSTVKHLRDHTEAVNMIEEFVAKACASCCKHFKPKAAQHKMCDGCFSRCDKKAPKLSSADTSVTMTIAAQESFKQRRKFKAVKKNAKHWSSKKTGASSSSGPPSKKGKSEAVHMITAFNNEDSTEHTSKKARLASPDIENADQSADDESDNDLQLAGATHRRRRATLGHVHAEHWMTSAASPCIRSRPACSIEPQNRRSAASHRLRSDLGHVDKENWLATASPPSIRSRPASQASLCEVNKRRSLQDGECDIARLMNEHGDKVGLLFTDAAH